MNKKITYLLCSLFLINCLCSNAQEDLKTIYKNTQRTYQNQELDSAKKFSNELLAQAQNKSSITYQLLAYNYLAVIAADENNSKGAFENQFAVLKVATHDSLIKYKARALNGLGVLYFTQKQFDLAKKFFKEEISIRQQEGDSVKLANNLINLSSVYRNLKQTDSVMHFLNRAGVIAYKKNKPVLLAHYFNSKANHYFWMLKNEPGSVSPDSAAKYYQKAISIWYDQRDLQNAIKPLTNLGYLYQTQNNFIKAIAQFLKSESIADSLQLIEEKVVIYGNLAETYTDAKNYLQASIYFRKLVELKDSIQKTETKQYAVMLEKQYQLENKSKTIIQQKLELEQKNNRINTQQKQLYLYLLVLIVLIAIVAAIIVYANFNKRVAKKIEEAKEKFFVNIMHEIRTPLSMIQAPLKALQPKVTDEESKYYISLAEKNADRLNELMSQMLEVSKINSDAYKLNMATGNPQMMIGEISNTYEKLATEKNIRFVPDIQLNAQTVLFDKDALEKIITNLLSNAIKYTPANGIIGFSAGCEEKEATLILKLEVWDTGVGIPKAEQDKLFTRFFRSKNSATHTKGVGIGLSLVKDLVNAYKGKIYFVSEENKGSKFNVELELSFAQQSVFVHSEDTNSENPLILIIEDDEDISGFLGNYLQSKNFSVLKAANGNIAKTILKNTLPNLIVTDLMMEELDGLSFIKEIKADKGLNHIPVIVLSAKSNSQSRIEVLNAGAQVFIAKPFVPEELFSIIGNQLELINKFKTEFKETVTDKETVSPEHKFVSSDAYTQKLFSLIFTHLDNPDLGVEFLADLMGTNRSHFQRKIKNFTGYSPSEIIRMIRLEKAREFLLANKGNITEVAYMCGFSSQSYFTKCFTEHFNETPSAVLQTK
ncbi:MAG: response regulator [Bacteroidota bacterium]